MSILHDTSGLIWMHLGCLNKDCIDYKDASGLSILDCIDYKDASELSELDCIDYKDASGLSELRLH